MDVAATALAMARVAWAMLTHGTNYEPDARGRLNAARPDGSGEISHRGCEHIPSDGEQVEPASA